MRSTPVMIGIDIGTVSVSAVAINHQGDILGNTYRAHGGRPRSIVSRMIEELSPDGIEALAVTASSQPLVDATAQYDARVAAVRAARHYYRNPGAILLVGGEKFSLIRFDGKGNYSGCKTNTSCAAGTGSFLDQQAQRLSLSDSAALSALALQNCGTPPKIASRCAVFAKTDLIHAQQEGYTLAAICDGLCLGLARNIVDTLFAGDAPPSPIVFAGGVAKNQAVVRHIQQMVGRQILVHRHCHLFCALGAALMLLDEHGLSRTRTTKPHKAWLLEDSHQRTYHYPPLTLHLSDYPDFADHTAYLFEPGDPSVLPPVEVDLYANAGGQQTQPVWLGVDIGSTSTKAVLLSPDQQVLAGCYTRTAGRPLAAMQAVLAALVDMQAGRTGPFRIMGAGTTGSGRKFIGQVLGADLVLDEISAHARAAVSLHPDVDTIIEIGGQDAKFTTLQNGAVTTAIMNSVCAAGTGSFIEEQAHQLGCSLEDFSERTRDQRAPLASDRCTVFMERDLRHYLSRGYAVEEVLAAVLHSVRDNYLAKVAVPAQIGRTVLFQGATAKNRALVAAFEQRLQQPIHVSRYCHLTGALGVALSLADQGVNESRFRGLDLHRKDIPVHSDSCNYCVNHCKITSMTIDGRTVAYGFLCGRDADTHRRINKNPSGFDLQRARRKAFARPSTMAPAKGTTVGIPAALHLYEDMAMWQYFFDRLGIPTITSETCNEAVSVGKHAAGAEFCMPMAALHGHVRYLLDRADIVFLPYYLETKGPEKGVRRQYCYYTQYATPLAAQVAPDEDRSRLLMPLVHYLYHPFHTMAQLYQSIKAIVPQPPSFGSVSLAYEQALIFKRKAIASLKARYSEAVAGEKDIHVLLLGRPYTVLPPTMNKGIPAILSNLGIKVFYQDMLSYDPKQLTVAAPLLKSIHWHYAAEILSAAEAAARTPGAYPVLVTAFKCSPDSFAVDYFKKIMNAFGKPYLVLQLDEHDSAGGYETRIEAAVRAFRHHHAVNRNKAVRTPEADTAPLQTINKSALLDKTLLMPNWDRLTLPLIVAAMQKEGIDARLLEGSRTNIQKGMQHNSGQCIPLNIITQDVIDYVETHNLNPAKTVLWMAASSIACNIHLYPAHIRYLLEAYGKGMERTGIYLGPISLQNISIKLPTNVYFAYMFGGYLRRMGCRVRPYETIAGLTDQAVDTGLAAFTAAFMGQRSKADALKEIISVFETIPVSREAKPKVALFGDMFTRDYDLINQNIIAFIEANGGEVVTTPYSEYMKMITKPYLRKWLIEGNYLAVLSTKFFSLGLKHQENAYYQEFQKIIDEPEPDYPDPPDEILLRYNLRLENTGEAMDNILKVHYLTSHHPDLAIMAQTSPAFCCPALVTEAMARSIEMKTGVPIVSITYDGTGGNKNEVLIPYLKFAAADRRSTPEGRRPVSFGH